MLIDFSKLVVGEKISSARMSGELLVERLRKLALKRKKFNDADKDNTTIKLLKSRFKQYRWAKYITLHNVYTTADRVTMPSTSVIMQHEQLPVYNKDRHEYIQFEGSSTIINTCNPIPTDRGFCGMVVDRKGRWVSGAPYEVK